MKSMTCKQLGGACDKEFHAPSFEEIAEASKNHGREMLSKGDQNHIKAMDKMQELMKSPADMQAWYEKKREEFDAQPEIQ